jgi:ribosomal protein S18 acetylase RimI-like enzyme
VKIIELLEKRHDCDDFDCGSEALNQFLRQTARQHIQKGISRTFVLVDTEQPNIIMGFFTLSLCEVRSATLSPQLAKKYPLQIPAVKLARLAVAQTFQCKGLGEILMVEAMQRAVIVADNAGGIDLFVDAKDAAAKVYYENYGFTSLEDNSLVMFLPLSTLYQNLNQMP